MTTGQLLDLLRPEINNVFSSRAYLNSQDKHVLLIDMYYDDDLDPTVEFIKREAPALDVSIIVATPFGGARRHRIVVTGFTK